MDFVIKINNYFMRLNELPVCWCVMLARIEGRWSYSCVCYSLLTYWFILLWSNSILGKCPGFVRCFNVSWFKRSLCKVKPFLHMSLKTSIDFCPLPKSGGPLINWGFFISMVLSISVLQMKIPLSKLLLMNTTSSEGNT